MLIVVVVLFLLCWGPKIIIDTLIVLQKQIFSQEFYALQIVFTLLQFIHCCINPIIYCFMSNNFRKSMSRVFGKSCCSPNMCKKCRCSCCKKKSDIEKDIYLRRKTYEMTSLYLPNNESGQLEFEAVSIICHKDEVNYDNDEVTTDL